MKFEVEESFIGLIEKEVTVTSGATSAVFLFPSAMSTFFMATTQEWRDLREHLFLH